MTYRKKITEGIVRGKYTVALGLEPAVIGQHVKPINLPNAGVLNATNALYLFNRAPHPNAAKLFINWILTKEGQTAWSTLKNIRHPGRDPQVLEAMVQ